MAVCITPDSLQEVYLNCGQVGVINILEAEYGKRSSSTGGQCNYPLDSACTQDAGADPALLTNCMGQESCNFPVNAITIPQCKTAVTSDYFQVKYQCVPGRNLFYSWFIMGFSGNNYLFTVGLFIISLLFIYQVGSLWLVYNLFTR